MERIGRDGEGETLDDETRFSLAAIHAIASTSFEFAFTFSKCAVRASTNQYCLIARSTISRLATLFFQKHRLVTICKVDENGNLFN